MDIKYTYKDDDRPICKAEFKTWGMANVKVEVDIVEGDSVVRIQHHSHEGRASYSKQDFADFTALVNRINKQISNES
ncbi:MAG: hypothetical protein JL50_11065 [Peptococcaceae bacterium BICA1-7]|nr:MAG: hypothetical protein JL50_11065 [Peptococcaceae bacterium BICA1-7]HBV95826.1 hypothetical protein [Desulfotomaculum sp.]